MIDKLKEAKYFNKLDLIWGYNIGFVNFYWCFIQNFSHTAKPLNELKYKKEWKWDEEHQQAFKILKDKITSQPVLSLPKRKGKFRIEIDTSGHAIGKVLSQEQDGKWKPITFLLRMIQLAERNYKIYDKELLVIVEALMKWRQYLLDTMKPLKVWIDHENLKYFWEPHRINKWQAQWYLKLQDYDFTLQYILGKTNTKADILSRKDQINMKEDNKDIQMLKEELWMRRTTAEVMMLKRITTMDKQDKSEEMAPKNKKWSKHWKRTIDYYGKKMRLYT